MSRTQISLRTERQAIDDAKAVRGGMRLVTLDADRVFALVKAVRMPVVILLNGNTYTVATPSPWAVFSPVQDIAPTDVTAMAGCCCVAYDGAGFTVCFPRSR